MIGRAVAKAAKRLGEWFKGYDDAPLWICFARFIFAMSSLALIVSFCGPAILVGDLIGFMAYQEWIILSHASFLYIVAIAVTFILAVISGIPTILYERKKMEKSDEKAHQN